ncbi:MAG: caspase family protein [Burkholderiaceae bacterium]
MAKNALCIGINNYPGTQMDLAGCVNDANDWADELQARGFAVTRLLDEQATKKAMADGFEAIIGGARGGDVVVITFSGHGTYVPDEDGDEVDHLDEALCPHDIKTGGGPLTDDEIHELFMARKPGVRLVLIADSCHSGTVTRAAAPDPDADDAPRPRFLPMGNWMPDGRMPKTASGRALSRIAVGAATSPFVRGLSRRAGDLLLSGCQEGPNSFSYDARIKGRFNGAFTYYALKALEGLGPKATYADWHAAINPPCLPSASYPQSPQIVGTAAARERKLFT